MVKFKQHFGNSSFKAFKVMTLIKEHDRAKISYSVATEMMKMASRSSLWLAEQELAQSNPTFNLRTFACFWSGKICFIEESPDQSQSSAFAASCLLEKPSYRQSIETNSRDTCFLASEHFLFCALLLN